MEFSKQVYKAISLVPKGKVTTYKAIAELLGTKAYRAVGLCLGKNPYAPVIPCHRVIRSDRTVGGYKGGLKASDVKRKKELLLSEGVIFEDGKVLEECVLRKMN